MLIYSTGTRSWYLLLASNAFYIRIRCAEDGAKFRQKCGSLVPKPDLCSEKKERNNWEVGSNNWEVGSKFNVANWKICDLIFGSPPARPTWIFLQKKSAKEVEVLGEIHFLQNARLEGSLRFRKARVGEVPSDHRCVDVGDAQV